MEEAAEETRKQVEGGHDQAEKDRLPPSEQQQSSRQQGQQEQQGQQQQADANNGLGR